MQKINPIMEVKPVTELTDTEWEKYYNFNLKLFDKYYPDIKQPFTGWIIQKEKTLEKMRTFNEDNLMEFVIVDNNEITGWFDRSFLDSKLFMGFDAVYKDIPRNVFKAIFENIYKLMAETGTSEATWVSYDTRKIMAIEGTGVKRAENYQLSRLDRDKADIQFFEKCIEETEKKYDYNSFLYSILPEELRDKYSEFAAPVFRDIALTDPTINRLEFEITPEFVKQWIAAPEKNDMHNYFYLLYNSEEEIIGVTNVTMHKSNPEVIFYSRGFTGIKKDYRGKNLGRYLKAKMFLQLQIDFPDFKYIQSDTMPWNRYMFAINEELGFKPFKKGGRYLLTIEFLKKFIKENN